MSREKKYELTDEVIEWNGRILHRIRAVRNVRKDVPVGTLGGYVEKENNLSHSGEAWVSGKAKVYGDSKVYGNAWVYDKAEVSGKAKIYGEAWVSGEAKVYGKAKVYGDSKVYGNAWVYDKAEVYGEAEVSGKAKVYGEAWVYGNAEVSGKAKVSGKAGYMVFKNTWSSGRWFSCFRDKNGILMWKVGCFYGTGAELVAKAYNDSQLSGDCYKAVVDMAEKVFAMTSEDSDNKED